MTQLNDPQSRDSIRAADECGFCHRPLQDYHYRVGDRVTCASCAAQINKLQALNQPSNEMLVSGFGWGLAAAVGAGIAWAVVQRATGYQLGILAWGIGVVVAKAVLFGSQQHRGKRMQIIAMSMAALGVVLGKLIFIFLIYRDIAIKERIEPTIGLILQSMLEQLVANPKLFVDPFDLIWLAIALFTAWRICAPVRIPLSGPFGSGAANAPAFEEQFEPVGPPASKRESPRSILLKTGGSMLLSILVYQWYAGWGFAVGFVLLILVHELGHVIANLHYGIRSSPPVFIPFVGAVIALRQQFPDAKVEAISALAGPVAGTIGAIAALGWYLASGSELALILAGFGFMMNLFNLLPLPPLDGGRVMAAVSPWVWILGLAGMGALVVSSWRRGQDVSVLLILLVLALPRVILTLRSPDERANAYYRIHRAASLAIGGGYLALLVFLVGMSWYCKELGVSLLI